MVASTFRRSVATPLIVALLAFVTVLASLDPAEARKRRNGYNPPYASIVIDVNTGRVLQATNADAPRFPASITKVMTLYMLFEQLERGKLRLDSELPVSAFAARQSPSKIGFDAGETVAVEDAIRALITKSANDVAVVVAEAIGGDEETFAELMTRKARAIGMRSTTFKNASGLPNREQVTTARDLTVLGRAIHEHFPKYWRYFQTHNFEYAGRNYRNHNRLLGRVEGVDGIKTGFTRASGFNLLTSARDGNRHIMAVVLGGRSGRIRDAQMASLVDSHLDSASGGGRTAPMIARAGGEEPVRVAGVVPSSTSTPRGDARVEAKAEARPETTPAQRVEARMTASRPVEAAKTIDADRQRENDVRRAIAAAPAQPTRTVAAATIPAQPRAAAQSQSQAVTAFAAPAAQAQPGPQLRWTTGAQPAAKAETAKAGRQASTAVAQADPVTTASTTRASAAKGFVIQLGATDDETKARAILDNAKAKNRTVLADASAFTEKVQKGDATLFRARFSGFDDNKDANAACGALKKSGFNCFVQRI
jgi:D-alanyl-D-alanine carboxypeptidase